MASGEGGRLDVMVSPRMAEAMATTRRAKRCERPAAACGQRNSRLNGAQAS